MREGGEGERREEGRERREKVDPICHVFLTLYYHLMESPDKG